MPRRVLTAPSALMVLLLVLAFVLPAAALINPKFTPIQLASDAEAIVTVKVKGPTTGDRIELEITGALKGKAPAHLAIDLSKTAKQHADAARKQLAEYGDENALLFIGKDENHQSAAFMHIHGMWLRFLPGANGIYPLDVIDREMPSTWAGGTDMLIRCIRYIQSDDNADVPVQAGMEWQSAAKVAAFAGTAREMSAVDLAGDGKWMLFIAGEKGDRIFKPGPETFQDITPKLKLQSASRLAAWGEFSGDGRLDLASYDGTDLTIWSQAADGTFSAAKAGGGFTLPANCVGMTVIAATSEKSAGLLISPAAGAPVLLTPAGKGAFSAKALPAPDANLVRNLGTAGACVVADFTGDSIVDVIQPYEKGGLIYRGNKSGGFDAPKTCGVSYGSGGGRAAIGDFDGDGLLDVLTAGADGVKIFQNLGDGRFEETRRQSGEVAYKGQPLATCCCAGDFNNDARQDMVIGYASQNPQVFFNRGFRSFGEAPHLELDEAPSQIPDIDKGQQLVLLADLTNAGAQDLYVLTTGGELWRAFNSTAGDQPTSLAARIALKSSLFGPINVSMWEGKRCFGTTVARMGTTPAFFGVANPNSYTLKWTGPDGKPMSKDVVVDKNMTVTLP